MKILAKFKNLNKHENKREIQNILFENVSYTKLRCFSTLKLIFVIV